MPFEEFADRRLTELATEMPRLLEPFTQAALEEAERLAYRDYSGRILQVRSGALRRSLRMRVEVGPDGPTGTLSAGDSRVTYARIHEFGGMAGRRLTTHIPARPILRPALEEAARLTAPIVGERLRMALGGG